MRTFFHVCLSSVFSCCSTFSELFPCFSHSFTSFSHLNMYNLCIPTLESLYTFFQRILSTRRFLRKLLRALSATVNIILRGVLRITHPCAGKTWKTHSSTLFFCLLLLVFSAHAAFFSRMRTFFCCFARFYIFFASTRFSHYSTFYLRMRTLFSVFQVFLAHSFFDDYVLQI